MLRQLLIATAMFTQFAYAADDVRLYRESDRVDPRDVARILGGGRAAAPVAKPAIRTRSIRMLDDPATPAAPAAQADADAPQGQALALPIQFGFDSDKILPRARTQLDALAQGVRLLDPGVKVTIEGHTDAKGSDEYNKELSRRRAEAVKNYLVTVQGIDGSRLSAVGKGKFEPYDEAHPFSPENRRVQFRGN